MKLYCRKKLNLVWTLLLGISLMLGITFSGVAADSGITIRDQAGRQVTLERIPERIVSLSPGNTEILFALGLDEKIVGVTNYCDYPVQAQSKPKVGGFVEINIEKVIELDPDVVFATGGVQAEIVQNLTELGLTVVVVQPKTLQEVLDAIELVGKAVGEPVKAKALTSQLQARIDGIRARVKSWAKREPRKVLYELWYDPLMTVGPGSFIHDLIVTAGGINIAGDSNQPYPVISLETVVAGDPDVIIYSHGAMSPKEVGDRKGWQEIEAVHAGRIILIPDENILSRPGPRLVDGLEAMARAIYPEAFEQ